jgi:hypothetical protein
MDVIYGSLQTQLNLTHITSQFKQHSVTNSKPLLIHHNCFLRHNISFIAHSKDVHLQHVAE